MIGDEDLRERLPHVAGIAKSVKQQHGWAGSAGSHVLFCTADVDQRRFESRRERHNAHAVDSGHRLEVTIGYASASVSRGAGRNANLPTVTNTRPASKHNTPAIQKAS